MLRIRPAGIVLIFLVALTSLMSQRLVADVMTFTSRSAFNVAAAASAYSVKTVNFDSVSAPYVIADGVTFDSLTFSYAFSGSANLQISNVFSTTSGANFLGTDDGSSLLQDGDSFSVSFAPRSAVGLYVISADTLVDGDLRLTVGSDSASLNAAAVQQTLPDSSKVYFLGLLNNGDTFSSATLSTHGGGGAFTFNVDDLLVASATVPEPTVVLPVAVSLAYAAWRQRRQRRKTISNHSS